MLHYDMVIFNWEYKLFSNALMDISLICHNTDFCFTNGGFQKFLILNKCIFHMVDILEMDYEDFWH